MTEKEVMRRNMVTSEIDLRDAVKKILEQEKEISQLKAEHEKEIEIARVLGRKSAEEASLHETYQSGAELGTKEERQRINKKIDNFGDAITELLHNKPKGDEQFGWNDAIGKVMEMRNEYFKEELKKGA